MSDIMVVDTRNAGDAEARWSWRWDGALRCTAAMLIEERVRAECDRVRHGHAESRFFGELRDHGEAIADKLVAKALQAFARNRLLLIVNDTQVIGPNTEIRLDEPIEATFVRLTPLQAG